MIKRRKKTTLVDVEVGSFSDIAFLLIIFFILTTQIARYTGHLVTIPSGTVSEGEQKEEESKQITINIDSGQGVTYSAGGETGVPVTLDELKLRLLEQNFPSKEPAKRLVIVDSSPEVSYELYYKIVMIISDTGGVLTLIDHSGEGDK